MTLKEWNYFGPKYLLLSTGAISCLESDCSGQGSFGLSAKENVSIGKSGSALLMASQEWPSGADFVFSGGSTASPAGFWPTTPVNGKTSRTRSAAPVQGSKDWSRHPHPWTAMRAFHTLITAALTNGYNVQCAHFITECTLQMHK